MTSRARLTTFLTRLLAVAPATGCVGTLLPEPELDGEACLSVPLGDACPDEAAAEAQLVGTFVCTGTSDEIKATGAFLSSEDVVYNYWGSYEPYDPNDTAADTGWTSDPMTRCCYEAAFEVGESCSIGRPLVVDGQAVSARRAARGDWCGALLPDVSGLDPAARARLAAAWTQAALLEHASVPAFARVLLDLVALGAPSELVARTTAALADEVSHARACFALASAYAGHPVGPGPLGVPTRPAPTLAQLAVETFREGCVGETLAVGLAAAQLRVATDPAVRVVLQAIVRDEAEHAALAWDIVRWAIDVGGDEVRQGVAAALASVDADELGADLRPAPTGAAAHGISDPATTREALRGIYREVIAPSAADLLLA
jgi:hypothetical protein